MNTRRGMMHIKDVLDIVIQNIMEGQVDKIEFTGTIENGIVNYNTENWKEKFEKFKKQNELKNIAMTVEVVDTPMHFLHKYYRGYLLPALADAMGEVSQAHLHLALKKEFLSIPLDNDTKNIKSKHASRCNIYIREIVDEHGEVKAFVDCYTPSTGDITHKEMKDFIVKCENRLFVDLGSSLNVHGQETASEYRKSGMNEPEKIKNDDIVWGES